MLLRAICVVVLGTSLASAAAAQDDGVSIAVVSVGKDSPSDSQAIVVGQIARQGFERNPKYSVLELEEVLEGGEAPAALRRRRQAEAALDRGKAAYDAFELAPALESLAEAVVGFEQALASLPDTSPVVEALKFQGAAYVLSGDTKNGLRAFERAFVLDAGMSVAANNFPENVVEVVEDARVASEGKPTGTMTVYAAPPAAEVWVDGRFRGSAPISIDNLPVGRHYVRVVRDGYAAFGTPVDVGRRTEETVQATLRPTAKFAEFDDLASRLKTGSEQGAAQLAAMLKVDQLLWTTVEAAGNDVTVTATLTDGVGGGVLTTATKTFVSSSQRYRSDLELWFAQSFRKAQGADAPDDTSGGTGTVTDGSSFLPDKPTEAPTSGLTIGGWVLTIGAVVPLGVGIGFGIYSLVPWDAYKNNGDLFGQPALPHQLHPSFDDVWNSFLVSSIVADVAYVVTGILVASGVTLLVLGANQEQEIEDVLADGVNGRVPTTPRMAGVLGGGIAHDVE
jgi:tetratricopeptide (TPR) repeat protein